jgi:His-Xaa-Ser system protein HxsD
MELIQKLENGQILLRVNKKIYNHEAILSTAYKFTDNCYVHIAFIDSNYYGVYFTSKSSNIDLASQVNDFCNELIDQQLRYNLDKSNKSIKEMIIKKAFFPFQDNE